MKTSLIIDDKVFLEAKKEADKTGLSISEIISNWAFLGRDFWKKNQKNKIQKKFKPANLGPEKIDLNQRKNWMDQLDKDDV
jgi:hypothetical protein